MVKDSGLNNHVVNALCKEMSDEGYVHKTGQEASFTDKGYVFFHSGGYFPITQEQIKTENKIPSKKQVTPNANWLLRFIQNPVVKIVAYFIGALLIAYSIYYLRLNGDRPQ